MLEYPTILSFLDINFKGNGLSMLVMQINILKRYFDFQVICVYYFDWDLLYLLHGVWKFDNDAKNHLHNGTQSSN